MRNLSPVARCTNFKNKTNKQTNTYLKEVGNSRKTSNDLTLSFVNQIFCGRHQNTSTSVRERRKDSRRRVMSTAMQLFYRKSQPGPNLFLTVIWDVKVGYRSPLPPPWNAIVWPRPNVAFPVDDGWKRLKNYALFFTTFLNTSVSTIHIWISAWYTHPPKNENKLSSTRFHCHCCFVSEIIHRVVAHEEPPFRPDLARVEVRPEFVDLMVDCWSDDPEERPHFFRIVERLKKISGR